MSIAKHQSLQINDEPYIIPSDSISALQINVYSYIILSDSHFSGDTYDMEKRPSRNGKASFATCIRYVSACLAIVIGIYGVCMSVGIVVD